MTREEAIKTWLPIISMSIDNMPELKEAFDMAIKALEQEPILDKIRDEVMALRNTRAEEFDIDSDVFDDRVILRSDILDILDKYKSESEE